MKGKLTKVTPRKHVALFVQEDKSMIFLIRRLVEIDVYNPCKWTPLKTFKDLQLIQTTFHVSQETFEAMFQLYYQHSLNS